MHISEDLDLDVARPLEVLLQEHRAVTERGQRFAAGPFDRIGQRCGRCDDSHAFAAAARRRLDQDRIADLGGSSRHVEIGSDLDAR